MYLLMVFMRPVEWLTPWLEPVRPLALLSGLAFVLGFREISQDTIGAKARHYWLLLGLVATVGISVAANGWVGGVPIALSAFSTSALLFLLVSFYAGSLDSLRKACGAIAISMLVLASLGIYSFYTGYLADQLVLQQANRENIPSDFQMPSAPAEDKSGYYMWRVKAFGFFSDPNDFGQALVMTVPFLFLWHSPGKRLRNAMLVYLPLGVFVYCTYLTNSRGALLGLASLTFFQVKDRLGTVKTGLLVGLSGAAALALNFAGGRAISSKEESAAQRIEAWYEGFQMLKTHPLFGVGYGQFTEHHYLTAHNSFVLCFSELGLVGYFCWMGLVVCAFQAVFRVAKFAPPESPERKLAVVLRASLVGFFVCAYFLSRTYQPALYVLLALCIATWIGPLKAGRFAGIDALNFDAIGFASRTLLCVFLSIFFVYCMVVFR
jgi:putative inorganic carbon (hco3(-)) transporter